jgi:hypothetical protein
VSTSRRVYEKCLCPLSNLLLKKYHNLSYFSSDYDLERGQHIPNKALARYLARSNADYDENFLDYKKRAMFRKRGKNLFYFHDSLPWIEVHMWRIQCVMTKNHFLVLFTHERLGWFIRKAIKIFFRSLILNLHHYYLKKKNKKKNLEAVKYFFHLHTWLFMKNKRPHTRHYVCLEAE